MLNSSDAIVHETCKCPWWSIDCGGNNTPSGQHVGTALNLWNGKWFNLNRPGRRGGTIKIGQSLGPSKWA